MGNEQEGASVSGILPEYSVPDECVFTNLGSSGVKDNDGKVCRIIRVKLQEEWVEKTMPEYVIRFIHNGHIMGVAEKELELVAKGD